MKRTTRSELDEMRARRFDAETIKEAEFSETRTSEADQLCNEVRKAFAGVKLGQGIGLFEGQAIDDYESSEVRGEMRARDEKDSWESISSKDLNACYSSLSFFDSLGMRFHLPAFIIADLKGEFDTGMEFTLTYLDDYGRARFSDLSVEQRKVVRDYLTFLKDEPGSEFYRPNIDHALDSYWTHSVV